ncbi:MAG: hypothetical protein AB1631_08220 [Acidobacteriota bacterium]
MSRRVDRHRHCRVSYLKRAGYISHLVKRDPRFSHRCP